MYMYMPMTMYANTCTCTCIHGDLVCLSQKWKSCNVPISIVVLSIL